MKLGIMGGTFDPIHGAHIYIARAARDAAGLDQVLFVPSGNPPHKRFCADAQDRYQMVALAVRDLRWAAASRIETDREGRIYTVDTLAMLRRERPQDELFMIVGADALRDMPLWKDAKRAMQMCTLVAVSRPGISEQELARAEAAARERTGATVIAVRADSPDISSSMVRERLRAGQPVQDLLPAAVAAYIEDRGLYR